MRYILDDNGYIHSVSCTPFNCADKSCTEYTGAIPSGYETLQEWACNANIRAYKLVGGNLTFDAEKDAELTAEWENSINKGTLLIKGNIPAGVSFDDLTVTGESTLYRTTGNSTSELPGYPTGAYTLGTLLTLNPSCAKANAYSTIQIYIPDYPSYSDTNTKHGIFVRSRTGGNWTRLAGTDVAAVT